MPGPNFTAKNLKIRYRALGKQYHPDKNKGCPDTKKYKFIFAKLGFIHEVLQDAAKLKRYKECPTHEDFLFPGESVPTDAGAESPEAPAEEDAKPETAKLAPSLGQSKLYISFYHFQSDDSCHRFRSDDHCHPVRASPRNV